MTIVAPEHVRRKVGLRRRLMVNWQDPETRLYHQVAWLTRNQGGSYEFAYLPTASKLAGFRPFVGFRDLGQTYRSPHLFPLFTERLLTPGRADLPKLLSALELDEAEPMEFLARSGGRRGGDTIELLPEPTMTVDGVSSCTFLVHGVRYLPEAEATIDSLQPGDVLGIETERDNPVNPRALLVSRDGCRLGWVPNPLVEHVHILDDVSVTVVRANPATLGHHLRLLVRLEGRLRP